ncbi:MAG: hypothetical protein DMG30_14310 [Acidobacteria bacterium]|nr:MAG: hypothetical protein DMG30_14310 [Acidobacteriota bacterium]
MVAAQNCALSPLRGCREAGIGRIGWYTFRHTYSTLLHACGTDMKVQQELLRHSDIRTTMNIYTHMARSFE